MVEGHFLLFVKITRRRRCIKSDIDISTVFVWITLKKKKTDDLVSTLILQKRKKKIPFNDIVT